MCCESTARDAMMLDYRVVMLSDGNASLTDDEHAASLNNFLVFFGDGHDHRRGRGPARGGRAAQNGVGYVLFNVIPGASAASEAGIQMLA